LVHGTLHLLRIGGKWNVVPEIQPRHIGSLGQVRRSGPDDVSIDEPGALDGHIEVPGLSACRTFACGSDDATIRVYVKLDPAGAVLSEPKVYSGYRNCL